MFSHPDELVEAVRRGYDAVSLQYRSDDADPGRYAPWIAKLIDVLPPRARVLDLGCGCGVPVAHALDGAGHRVTGIDVSDVQIQRARALVPGAMFLRADATQLELAAGSFDAVVALYSFIHLPLTAQPEMVRSIASWLIDGGRLLLLGGATSWVGSSANWLGTDATMWWSHADAATYRSWLEEAGLRIESEEFVAEGESGHSLFWARRPSDG